MDWKIKKAAEIRDHDFLRGHGLVDWTVGYPHDQIAVHVHSGDFERGSYTLLLRNNESVSYQR